MKRMDKEALSEFVPKLDYASATSEEAGECHTERAHMQDAIGRLAHDASPTAGMSARILRSKPPIHENAKLLIVGAETIAALDMPNRLNRLGYQVVDVVGTGEAAVAQAEAIRPELVLVDIRLSDPTDGITAAGLIRRRCHLPVVFMTASMDDITLQQAELAEPLGYVPIPFEDWQLKTAIEVALSRHRREKETEAKRRELAEHANTIILRMTPEGRITAINQFAETFFGYTEEEILGRHVVGTIVPDTDSSGRDCAHLIQAIALQPERYVINEHENMRRNGERVWFSWTNKPIWDKHGNITEIQCIGNDLTERKRAEEDLRRSERNYREIFNSVSDAIFIHDGDTWAVLDVNDTMLGMFGFSREEALRMTPNDSSLGSSPYSATEALQWIAKAVAEGPQVFEWQARKKSGELFWVEVALKVAEISGQRRVLALVRDITERKRAVQALRESEDRYRRLIECSPDAIFVQSEGRIAFINSVGLKLLGASQPEQIIGKPMLELVHPDWRDLVGERMRTLREDSGQVPTIAEQYLRLDGTAVDVEIAATRYVLNGKPAVLVIARDITERIEAEEALRAAHQRLLDTIELLPEAAFILDEGKRVIAWNRACEQLTGIEKKQMLGKNGGDYAVPFYGERRAMLIDLLDDASPEMEATYKCVTRAGDRLYAEAFIPSLNQRQGAHLWGVAAPLFNRNGQRFGAIEVILDVTERKRLEDQLRQAQKLEAVGQLAGGVAHDFNNILTAILMNLSLLQDDPHLTPEMRTGLKELEGEANRASRLTRQLLLFSRRQTIDAKPLDLNEVINDLSKMLRRLIGEDIELMFEGQRGSSWVKADASMMEQVVMNLCVNARDAMPRGGRLTIGIQEVDIDATSLEVQPQAKPGPFVRLSVTDTGCGMDESTLKRIFEPFFTTKEIGKGTGLGLATVYGIVKQHQGWIEVDSAVGKGTTFGIYLPLLIQPEMDPESNCTANIRGGTETILLVEDEVSVRRVLALGLRKLGYAVFEAADGVQALNLWERHKAQIDLLLTDMVMSGGMTGLDLGERLRKGKSSLKIVLCSGYIRRITTPGVLAEKGISYLAKPYEYALLAKTIRDCLDQT